MAKPRERSDATETLAGTSIPGKKLARRKDVKPPGWLMEPQASRGKSDGEPKKGARPPGW